jgi:hypothetical protein
VVSGTTAPRCRPTKAVAVTSNTGTKTAQDQTQVASGKSDAGRAGLHSPPVRNGLVALNSRSPNASASVSGCQACILPAPAECSDETVQKAQDYLSFSLTATHSCLNL